MDKKMIFDKVEENGGWIIELGERLFNCPELGYKEFKTAEIIKEELEKLGIAYEDKIGLTGIKATEGKLGGYRIALVSDVDALPGKGFDGQIHSCGHSIQTAIALGTAKVLKELRLLEGTDVSVSFIFTPAEEFIDFEYRDRLIKEGRILYRSGKQNMIALGYFDDIDCVLSAHANGDKDTLFDINSTLAGFSAKKITFKGQTAHSGAMPYIGRNTLHGAVLCENAIEMLKNQFNPDAGVRINPVITESGGSVNSIPDKTVLETYVRANDIDTLMYAGRRVDTCAECSAKALELECEIEDTIGYMPLRQSKRMNKAIKNNMLLICDEDMIKENVVSGASGDVGDLGYLIPTVQFGFSGIDGIFHSDNFRVADEKNCYVNTVKIMCGTIADMIENAALRDKNENYKRDKEFYLKNWLKKS